MATRQRGRCARIRPVETPSQWTAGGSVTWRAAAAADIFGHGHPRAAPPDVAVTRVSRALAAVAFVAAAAEAQHPDTRGAILLRVVGAETAAPIPYADVRVGSAGFAAFTDSAGRLAIRPLPAGTFTVQVRRVGFRPVTIDVQLAAGETRELRVSLPLVALRLSEVRVRDDVCPGGRQGDTAVVTILQQARLNGERYAMLAERYPFEVTMERVFAEQGRTPIEWSGRRRARWADRTVQHQDTVQVAGRSEWRYAPGKLFVPASDSIEGAPRIREAMIVPHLADLSDTAFIATHCFRYSGLAEADSGRRVLKVDFRPTRELRERDVRGTMFLDPATYQIRKSTLLTDRPAPDAPGTHLLLTRVDTWFKEILPGIPVVHRIETTTTIESVAIRAREQPYAATEDHTMLGFRFLEWRPGEDSLTVLDAAVEPARLGPMGACPASSDSAVLAFGRGAAKLCVAADDAMSLHLDRELEVAGVVLSAGSYSVRILAQPDRWILVFSDTNEVGRGTALLENTAQSVSLRVRTRTTPSEAAFVVGLGEQRAVIPVWTRQ